MINNKSCITIFILCLLLLYGCDEDKLLNHDDDDKLIRATGTYLIDNIDKEKWGDFLLMLELDQSTFYKTTSFPYKLCFQNTGTKTIALDGILPYRQSANPPYICIWSNDSIYYQINNVLDDKNSMRSIIENWKKYGYNFNKQLFSVIGYKGRTAIHIFLYNPIEIDTDLFYSIILEIGKNVNVF